ncbi:BTAD domain-containing putative transcriptional regulator [Dactylosporangium sp. AC04546]|uniref:AfsR/SARP family transcriptional regulator n=1 Tax=Dactylosporangium sp. AC04546 TaxID=2862460 RepID=UPI001EDEE8B5|nr:AfsR/SARP family transcriptional regulator [Dactylosporangium sp. AC04546]WVK78701.1 BTAD domain-containing putative transcriptional regulator [Dactylosporangium sp. AC04546]
MFGLLGPARLPGPGGVPVAVPGTKARTLLAALLLAEGRAVPDDRLAELLWGGRPPGTARAQLYTYACRLRGRLDGRAALVRQARGYALLAGPHPVDVAEFERLAADGHRALAAGRPGAAAAALRAGLALWRGPALADVTEQLRDAEQAALEEARTGALESRIEAELALGEHLRLVPELWALVLAHPLRERPRAALMTALFRAERRAEAFLVYQEGCRLLDVELGAGPGPALVTAYRSGLAGLLA